MKTLVIGYGNTSRSDDAVGVFVAQSIEKEFDPEVEVRTAHQLSVEILEDFYRYERIILIDASIMGHTPRILRIQKAGGECVSTSHALLPETLLRLARELGYTVPELYLCHIPGEIFEFGENLSAKAKAMAAMAIPMIRNVLKEENVHA